MCVFTRKNQHNYNGNLSKVKAIFIEEYSDVTLENSLYNPTFSLVVAFHQNRV